VLKRIEWGTGAAGLLLFFSWFATSGRSATVSIFDGKSLTGWHTQGGADWRISAGQITGSAKGAGGGWLVRDHGYEDVIVRVTYQCNGCQAGVLLRDATVPGGGTSGLYASLTGDDATTVYRISLDAQGNETGRTLVQAPKPRGGLVLIRQLGGGWNQAEISAFGAIAVDPPAGAAGRGRGGRGAPPDQGSHYGQMALRVASGDIRIRNVSVIDLIRPTMGLQPQTTGPEFRKVLLTDRYYSEGIAVGDINRDGKMDVVSGPYAYLGPDFKQAIEIYPPETYNWAGAHQVGNYTNDRLSFVYDCNGDGWPDVLRENYDGLHLYVNPKGESRHWDEFLVFKDIAAETIAWGDIDGDGKPELIISQGRGADGVVGYIKPENPDGTKPWVFHPISTKNNWGPHGMGFGDINGDGRVDIVQGSGWFQQPAAGAASGLWEFHAVPFGHGTDPFVRGADMEVYDVNGDGLPDVVTSLFSHGAGLAWYEQKRDGGIITWKEHTIMGDPDASAEERKTWEETDKSVAFTELHALAYADMDGDGLKDIVAGKRWWSHGFEHTENDLEDPPVMYWFKLVRKAGGQVEFVPHLVNNFTGLGTQIQAVDVNGDGKPDVLTAARKGVFIFLNNIKR